MPTPVTPAAPRSAGPPLAAGLDAEQRLAVLADDPVVCVIAGAGTGKTRVLTLRVARRIGDRSAHPAHVLVCTFSRRAAGELRDRLWALGVGADVRAGTFHRTALRLVAQYRADHGLPAPSLLADRRTLLATLVEARPVGGHRGARSTRAGRLARGALSPRQRVEVARLDAEIGWAKARLVSPAAYEVVARRAGRRSPVSAARAAEIYERYEDERRARGALDLDDLLWHCGDLLEQDVTFARAVRWWHRHLFVDEMQDMNEAQFRLLRLLVGEDPDLFVVGDPNQSVYGWNGADPHLLRRVTEAYAGTRVVRLETNHRCTAAVVRVASAVLGRDEPPPSSRPSGPLPSVVALENDAGEARWVARQAWLAHRPGSRWSSIAVLARTNAQLATIAEALRADRVPHRVSRADVGPASDVQVATGAAGEAGAPPPAEGGAPLDHDPAAGREDEDGPADGAVGNPQDAVVLSTFHRAKGLQWRTVFVVGASDGLVPLVTARTKAAKEEERRLFYVALTRAEEELTCTWARYPGDAAVGGEGTARRPSPWLAAIAGALDDLGHASGGAGAAVAAEHLANIRALLAAPAGAADAGDP